MGTPQNTMRALRAVIILADHFKFVSFGPVDRFEVSQSKMKGPPRENLYTVGREINPPVKIREMLFIGLRRDEPWQSKTMCSRSMHNMVRPHKKKLM